MLVTLPKKISEYRKYRNELLEKYGIKQGANAGVDLELKATREESKKLTELARLSGGTKDFKSSHFDEPNILVHLRMNTRTDADGNKVLFLEEVQSDWGQKGKKEGFVEKVDKNNIQNVREDENVWVVKFDDGSFLDISKKEAKNADEAKALALQSKKERFVGGNSKIPTAPFVTDTNAWTKLGLKVALKEAVAQGADKIAWTTGEQQNARYDLSKTIEQVAVIGKNENDGKSKRVTLIPKDGETINMNVSDEGLVLTGDYKNNKLEDVIGKELSEKVLKSNDNQKTRFEGNDLKIGGKGMKGFYGSPTEGSLGIVGNVAKSLFKQEPKTVDIFQSDKLASGWSVTVKDKQGYVSTQMFDSKSKGLAWLSEQEGLEVLSSDAEGKNYSTQHSIDITPELKASVEGGQPLFKDAEAQYRIESGKNIIEAIKDFDGSPRATVALVHEIMHPTVVDIIDGAKNGNEVGLKHTKTIVDEYNKANPKNQITQDQLIEDNDKFKEGTTTKKYRAVQEFIAKSWEQYHREGGKRFSEAFQKLLDQITEAFRAVYKSLTGGQLTPELKQMFDELLGKEFTNQKAVNPGISPGDNQIDTGKYNEVKNSIINAIIASKKPEEDTYLHRLNTEAQVKSTVLEMTNKPMLFEPLVKLTIGKKATPENIHKIVKSDEFINGLNTVKKTKVKEIKDNFISILSDIYNNTYSQDSPFTQDTVLPLVDELVRVAKKSQNIPLPFINDVEVDNTLAKSKKERLKRQSDGDSEFSKIDRSSPEIDNIKQVIARHPDLPPDVWKALLSTPNKEGNMALTGRAINDMVSFARNQHKAHITKQQSNSSKKAIKQLQHSAEMDNLLAFNSGVVNDDRILTQDFLKEVANIAEESDSVLKENGRFEGVGNDVQKFTFLQVLEGVKRNNLHQYARALATVDKIENNALTSKDEIVGLGFAMNSVRGTIEDIQEMIDSGDYPTETVNGLINDINSLKTSYRRMHNAFMNAGSTAGGMLAIFRSKMVSIAMEESDLLKTSVLDTPGIKGNKKAIKEVSEVIDEVSVNQALVDQLTKRDANVLSDLVVNSSKEIFDDVKNRLKDKNNPLRVEPIDDLVARFVALSTSTMTTEEVQRALTSDGTRLQRSAVGGTPFEADLEAGKRHEILYNLGVAIMQQYPNRVLTFEDLTELIQTKLGVYGNNVTSADVRVAFASNHGDIRQKTIDLHKKQLSDIKKQAKIIDKLGKLLESMVLDKSTVTLNINGNDIVFYQVPISPDSYNNKWVKSELIGGILTQVDANKDELVKINDEVSKVGITINHDKHTGGVDKTFIRVSDPVNGGMMWADNVNLNPATETEKKLISEKIKKDTSAMRMGTPTLHKSAVILDHSGNKLYFTITDEGKWVTVADESTGELREATDAEIDLINVEVQKKGPYTEIQKTLTELMRYNSNLDVLMGTAEQAAFLNHIMSIINDLPGALSGLTIDNYTINTLLQRVANMKTLASVDKIENMEKKVKEKIAKLEDGTDTHAIREILAEAMRPEKPYMSRELSLAKERLRESKSKLNNLIQRHQRKTSDFFIRLAKLITNTFKSATASLDLSVMMIQMNLVFAKNLLNFDIIKGVKSVMKGEGFSAFISPVQKATVTGFKQALQAFGPGGLRKSADAYEDITKHPYYPYMIQAGLGISDPGVVDSDEDLFREDILDVTYELIRDKINRNTSGKTKAILDALNKIVTLKAVKQTSEASFLSFANMQRAAMFIAYIDHQKSLGNEVTSPELTQAARAINDLTMKATTVAGKEIGKGLQFLGYFLWAPKMYLAATKFVTFPIHKPAKVLSSATKLYKEKRRLDILVKLANALNNVVSGTASSEDNNMVSDYRTKNNINTGKTNQYILESVNAEITLQKGVETEAKGLYRANSYALRQNTTSLLALMGLTLAVKEILKRTCEKPDTVEIGLNPTKGTFGKVGCGGIYRDYTGNLSGYVRAFAGFIAKVMENRGSTTVLEGSKYFNDQDAGDILYEFYSRKLNPSFSVVNNLVLNRDFYGNPIYQNIEDLNSAGKALLEVSEYSLTNIIPLFAREVFNSPENVIKEGYASFFNSTFMDNINTFKDDKLTQVIAYPTTLALTAMGASVKENYSFDIKDVLKVKSQQLGAQFGLEAINFEPWDRNLFAVPLKGERDEEKAALKVDMYTYTRSKDIINKTASKYIREQLEKYYRSDAKENPTFVSNLEEKVEKIKEATSQYLKNEGYVWGYNLEWRRAALEFKDQIPQLSNEDENKVLYGRFPGDLSTADKLFGTNKLNISKELLDKINRKTANKMKELGFVKFGAKKKEVNEKLVL